MKLLNYLSLSILMLSAEAGFAQQNALDFDGIDDKVTVPGASQFISGSTQITMTMWVNPFNNVSTFPDYDGFAGFRNNTDADFYIIQLPGNSIEARFRNSNGFSYDVNYTGVTINSWQHFAMVYDGSNLIVYHNGAAVGSTPASGTISTTAAGFDIGNLSWTSAEFQFLGRMDDVSLWSIALSAQEIACLYQSGIDASAPGLELYYDFNQGVAGGNNTAVTSLNNAAGGANGILNGFALNGGNSNFVTGIPGYVTLDSATICAGETYILGSQTLTQSGTYTETLLSSLGCDSVVTLTLTVNSVDNTVFQNGFLLGCAQAGASYQWLDCQAGYAPIPGANFQTYTATANGSYAASITLNGCTDTSSCFTITGVGLSEANQEPALLSVYPNPVKDLVHLISVKDGELYVNDVTGRELMHLSEINAGDHVIDLSWLSAGVYCITFRSGESVSAVKLIKQ